MKHNPITPDELERLRMAIGKERYADYVYTQFVLGIPTSQFLALKKDSLTIEGSVVIKDTGHEIPATSDAIETILRRLDQPGTDLLFPRAHISRGVWLGWKPLTPHYYRNNIVRPLFKSLGIPEDRAPHRHDIEI